MAPKPTTNMRLRNLVVIAVAFLSLFKSFACGPLHATDANLEIFMPHPEITLYEPFLVHYRVTYLRPPSEPQERSEPRGG